MASVSVDGARGEAHHPGMAITDLADSDTGEKAKPAPGRKDDPAIVELCERINRVLAPEPATLAAA